MSSTHRARSVDFGWLALLLLGVVAMIAAAVGPTTAAAAPGQQPPGDDDAAVWAAPARQFGPTTAAPLGGLVAGPGRDTTQP